MSLAVSSLAQSASFAHINFELSYRNLLAPPPWQALQTPHAVVRGPYALYAIAALTLIIDLGLDAFFRNA